MCVCVCVEDREPQLGQYSVLRAITLSEVLACIAVLFAQTFRLKKQACWLPLNGLMFVCVQVFSFGFSVVQ